MQLKESLPNLDLVLCPFSHMLSIDACQLHKSFKRSTEEARIKVLKCSFFGLCHIHECSCKSFEKIVPVPKSHSQIARP